MRKGNLLVEKSFQIFYLRFSKFTVGEVMFRGRYPDFESFGFLESISGYKDCFCQYPVFLSVSLKQRFDIIGCIILTL